ncbi:MAG: response regulator [Candidatus Delongbacteria bacterium]|nr:response regulator [Candidatus Delongbacteria bacterium]
MRSKYILLIEDDQNDVELTVRALKETFKGRVAVLNDGTEGIDFLMRKGKYEGRQPENPAVVILDKKMPKMDGIELLQAVRKEESLKNIPIVMFSSSNYEQDIIESYEAGVNAYVVKPIEIEHYYKAVRNIGYFWGVLNEENPENYDNKGEINES